MLGVRAVHVDAAGHHLSAKTPVRGTKNRGENAYQGPMTVHNATNKGSNLRTPFHPKTAQPQRLLKGVPGSTSTKGTVHLITRSNKPLADKTPFANRILNLNDTPAPPPKSLRFNTLIPSTNEQAGATPDSAYGSARPSSMRRHSRTPKANVTFQTPVNQGNHWDVSDGDIVAPELEQVPDTEDDLEYSDEIEYMPPNTLCLPYRPLLDFDLPNYTQIGQAALRSVCSYPTDELPPPTFDFHISDTDLMKWDSLSLPPLEGEISFQGSKRPNTRSTVKPMTVPKPTTTTTSSSRATSTLGTIPPISKSTTTVSVRRPMSSSVTTTSVKYSAARTPLATNTPRPRSTITRSAPTLTKHVSSTIVQPRSSRMAPTRNTGAESSTLVKSASGRTVIRPHTTKPASSAITKATPARSAGNEAPKTRTVSSKPLVSAPTKPRPPNSVSTTTSRVNPTKSIPASVKLRGPATATKKLVASKSGGVGATNISQATATLNSGNKISTSTKSSTNSSSNKIVKPSTNKLQSSPRGGITLPGESMGNAVEAAICQGQIPCFEEQNTEITKQEVATRSSHPTDPDVGNDVLVKRYASNTSCDEGKVIRNIRPSTEGTELPKVIEALEGLAIIVEETSAEIPVDQRDKELENGQAC